MTRTAVILAAGSGTRLGKLGKTTPKGLVEIGGEPIMARSVRILLQAGVEEVCLVVGHLGEDIKNFFESYENVSILENKDFAISGSLRSLETAFLFYRKDLFVLDSDIVYEGRAVSELLAARGSSQLLVSGPTGAGDEVWVSGASSRATSISKEMQHDQTTILGEFVGISLLRKDLLDDMFRSVFEDESSNCKDYEQQINLLLTRHTVETRVIRDLEWAEIDTLAQLARAKHQVFPKIMLKEETSPSPEDVVS